jgi:hypothetical protein
METGSSLSRLKIYATEPYPDSDVSLPQTYTLFR